MVEGRRHFGNTQIYLAFHSIYTTFAKNFKRMGIIRFLKDWTLPVAIATGAVCFLTFYFVPALDRLGDTLGPVIDVLFPVFVFLTLFVTFCKVDFHQMRPHRWQAGVLAAQLVLVAVVIGVTMIQDSSTSEATKSVTGFRLFWESLLTCIIGPAAAASPVVVGKLGGNISTMSSYVLLSSIASALMIPLVFPILEPMADVAFIEAFLIILEKVSYVLLLPLVLGWVMQHYVKGLCRRIASVPDLNFYCWAISLSITTGITVKNIVHSEASLLLLLSIAAGTFVLCWVQFGIGRLVGRHLGEEINSGQGLFQKNTALSIWVSYMYLNPVASIGAGCYVLWQNIINSIELKR